MCKVDTPTYTHTHGKECSNQGNGNGNQAQQTFDYFILCMYVYCIIFFFIFHIGELIFFVAPRICFQTHLFSFSFFKRKSYNSSRVKNIFSLCANTFLFSRNTLFFSRAIPHASVQRLTKRYVFVYNTQKNKRKKEHAAFCTREYFFVVALAPLTAHTRNRTVHNLPSIRSYAWLDKKHTHDTDTYSHTHTRLNG